MSEVAVNGDDFRVGSSARSSSSSCDEFTTPSPPPSSSSNKETTTSWASSTRVETGQPDTPVRCFPDIEKMVNSFALDDDDASCTEEATEFPDDEERQPQEEEPTVVIAAVSGHESEHTESSSATEIFTADDLYKRDEQSETSEGSYAEEEDEEEVAEVQQSSEPAVSFDEPESTVVLDDLAADRYEPSPELVQLGEEEEEEDAMGETEKDDERISSFSADKGHLMKDKECEALEPVTTEEDDSYSVADEETQHHTIAAEEEFEAINRSMQSFLTDEGIISLEGEYSPPTDEPIFAEEEYEKYVQSRREEASLFVEIEQKHILERQMEPLGADEAIEPFAAAASETEEIPTKPTGMSHILILTSSLGMNNRNQHRAIQLLDALGFLYENLDGSDPANKDIRNELFRISGMHGVYPLLFVVREDDALDPNEEDFIQFLGDWETVEGINDSSALPKEILDANPGILTWDKIPGLVRTNQY